MIVHPDMQAAVPATAVAIVADDRWSAWAKVAALFHPLPPPMPGVHPSAVVAARRAGRSERRDRAAGGDRRAAWSSGRAAGSVPLAVIGDGVVIGARCAASARMPASVHALIGDRVYIYPGARIGQDGFGFAMTPEGFLTVPQLGRVVIEDDVEIGANTHDRSRLAAKTP